MSPHLLDYLKKADRTCLIANPEEADYKRVALKVFTSSEKKELTEILLSLMKNMRVDEEAARKILNTMVERGIIKVTPNPFIYQVNKQSFFDTPDA